MLKHDVVPWSLRQNYFQFLNFFVNFYATDPNFDKVFTKSSQQVLIENSLKDSKFQRMLMIFSNYLLRPVYPSMVYFIRNATLLYITQNTGREPDSFQQLSKLFELELIFTTWPH